MAAKNDVTGNFIVSKASSHDFVKNYDTIYGHTLDPMTYEHLERRGHDGTWQPVKFDHVFRNDILRTFRDADKTDPVLVDGSTIFKVKNIFRLRLIVVVDPECRTWAV